MATECLQVLVRCVFHQQVDLEQLQLILDECNALYATTNFCRCFVDVCSTSDRAAYWSSDLRVLRVHVRIGWLCWQSPSVWSTLWLYGRIRRRRLRFVGCFLYIQGSVASLFFVNNFLQRLCSIWHQSKRRNYAFDVKTAYRTARTSYIVYIFFRAGCQHLKAYVPWLVVV